MNFSKILNELEQADPEVYERLSGRRQVLKSFGSKVAVAALPFAVGALFNKAYGKNTDAVVDVLNFALELEYLEYNYYHIANNTSVLIPTADKAGFVTIENHEKAHVNFLKTAITAMGGVPFTPKNYVATAPNPLHVPTAYDFTAGGTYHPFEDYATFLTLAAVFEDTGVHAYKGQLPVLLGNTAVLKQTFQIQSVEGRHAAHVRLLRRLAVGAPEDPAPWITNDIPPFAQIKNYYKGENNTIQNGIDLLLLPDAYAIDGTVPEASATAAFDESKSKSDVMGFIAPFKL